MDLPINPASPSLIHIDLNSCFATVMQQSHIHLRGKPLVIAAYTSPGGCIYLFELLSYQIFIKFISIKIYDGILNIY